MAHNEMILSWLNDAYAMEQSITEVLENHVKDAKKHPMLQQRLQQHLDATRQHAEMDKAQIKRLGGDVSSVKSTMSKVMGKAQGMSTGMADDELIKNALSDYSTEHMEIASYTALIAAGQMVGDQELVMSCQQILQDEREMARFLDDHLPMLVREQLEQKLGEHAAQTGMTTQQEATPS